MGKLPFGVICFFGLIVGISSVYAWDYPLDVYPEAIRFNHDTSSGEHDALTVRRDNGANIVTAPEYSNMANPAIRDSIAYAIDATNLSVLAIFSCFGMLEDDFTIDAVCTAGSFFDLAEKQVYFNGSSISIEDEGNPTNYVTLNKTAGSSLPSSVGRYTFTWQWRVTEVYGQPLQSPVNIAETRHGYYAVLTTPLAPMSQPWTDVLDYSCDWASGKTTIQTCVDSLTTKIFTCGAIYDSGATGYVDENDKLKLGGSSGILYKLNNQISFEMDCRAFSHFFNVLASSLGIESFYEELSVDEGEIETRETLVAGDPSSMWPAIGEWLYNTYSFAKHQISTVNINGEKIVDTALLLYNTQYLTSPVEFQFQSGVNPFVNYGSMLESYSYLLGGYTQGELEKTSNQGITQLQ